jgi:hypothetical protein
MNELSLIGGPPSEEELHELTVAQEDDLEQSIAEIERGEFVTAKALFEQLRAIRERASNT